ncbi:MAG TPA: NAD(P) transhydrogenase subunit alpha [Stackebrandtia sp.]|uniref:NAD(P) transhydrogenase subunit alpha n=1 Tax=Stackebrandtia sp. TaxID=2023065 RepID=UPI002D4C5570|nr:NAD(P) transhydrogenase subunit alpha [Stackebrandtia sp.]HZE41429.1 NAD(P) transhydrogenase subunit alpha [Stackebrandtia sp.]
MGTTTVGVIRELHAGERRVSLTPEAVARLRSGDCDVLVEPGAGAAAGFFDEEYEAAGATLVSADALYERADVLTCVDLPERRDGLRDGQLLIGLLNPLTRPGEMRELAALGVTAVSLDMLPRKLSRAQTMDALSSQASIAGYKAAVLAADTYGRYFPMLTTAAGTTSPATVLVLGTGVAGLSAIGTARRLGAMVTAYDVRPEAKGEAESLGAKFLELASVASAGGEGGYARELTEDERDAQQLELASHIGRFNVVITTARVPGRTPPLLVTRKALEGMAAGSVVVDMGASRLGGNVAQSQPGETLEVAGGVTVIGAGNLASDMAPAASTAYARNLSALLRHLAPDGPPRIDPDDEIAAGVVITHGGAVVHPALAEVPDES